MNTTLALIVAVGSPTHGPNTARLFREAQLSRTRSWAEPALGGGTL